MMDRFSFSVFLIAVVGFSGTAQIAPGDFIGACVDSATDAVYASTPGSGTVRTIATFGQPSALRTVVIGADNATLYCGNLSRIVEVLPGGSKRTLLGAFPMGIGAFEGELDEDGAILVASGANFQARDGGVFRFDPSTQKVTTVIATVAPRGLALDRSTGDILVADATSGGNATELLRVRRDGAVTTIGSLPYAPNALEYHPESGDTFFGVQGTIFRIDRANRISTFTTRTFFVGAMHVHADGRLVYGTGGRLFEYDRSGALVRTLYSGSAAWQGLAVADERNVWGSGAARVGAAFPLNIRFGAAPGKPYLAAAAFASRPGFRIGGHLVPLAVDDLFSASQSLPTLFRNFSGVLDASGAATATVMIPNAAALRGKRVFFAAVAFDPNAPSGVAAVSREYGIEIR